LAALADLQVAASAPGSRRLPSPPFPAIAMSNNRPRGTASTPDALAKSLWKRETRERSHMRKSWILSLTGLGLATLTTPAKAEDIAIAVAGPMTGPVASIGEQMKRGAETAAAAINDAGGVNGRKIKIVIEDDACDPKQAVAIANRIVGQQIKYIDGHACSGSSIPAADVYADNSLLMMSPASSNPVLTEKGHSTIMRLYPRDDKQGEFIAPWIAEKYKGKKIAILHDKSAYGKGLAQVVKDKLNAAGVTEVLFEGINPGEKDYTAVITKLKNAGAEFVYFGGYHTEAGLMLRQAADQSYKLNLMTGDSIATSEFWQISGPAGEGTLFTFPTDPRRSPNAAKALEQFKAQGFDPEGFTLFSYGVVQAIAEGIKRAGSDDPKAIAKALEDGKPVETVMGPVRFDSKGDVLDPSYDINVWSAGKYAPIAK
jgi:branched-chain amino acid transport system substrate-binding protein